MLALGRSAIRVCANAERIERLQRNSVGSTTHWTSELRLHVENKHQASENAPLLVDMFDASVNQNAKIIAVSNRISKNVSISGHTAATLRHI
jgi:hypothetical protein